MKNLFLTLFIFISTLTLFGQNVNLSDIESTKSYLDGKTFTVGSYGTITFQYKSYDKDFNSLVFNVIYEIPSQKKPKKLLFETKIMLTFDEFVMPSFTRPVHLNAPGLLYSLNFDVPLYFDLYENGELYYMDKLNYDMEEYLDAKKNGRMFNKTAPYKLCT
jgi:hypothetical protein